MKFNQQLRPSLLVTKLSLAMAPFLLLLTQAANSQPQPSAAIPSFRITVNSNQDGPIRPDAGLTLREAIEIANGNLPWERLSQAEKMQVAPVAGKSSRIEFALLPEQTTIQLAALLPDLAAPGLVIDGATQPGYGDVTPPRAFIPVPVPIVSLTSAPDQNTIFRGFTITADRVTIRGLSLYGFTSTRSRATQPTPPADIFISNAPPPVDAGPLSPPIHFFDYGEIEKAPQDVVIELNWLGITPADAIPEIRSAFGVSVFNGVGAVIRQNRIDHHQGSAIITGVRAQGMQVTENSIIGNGVAGIPDAIRLEGEIGNAQIVGNLICANDGSGVFMFKPEGAAQLQDNDIRFNGRRFQRAAVYVMGDDHQVRDNFIGYQPGPGVVVSAFPRSDRNLIRHNRFAGLEGLSIDLITHNHTQVQDYQIGDGPNPPRNSYYRRVDTGNGAMNAPAFDNYTFNIEGDQVLLTGKADPETEVDIYQVTENAGVYSPLDQPLTTVNPDANGKFSLSLALPPGARVSAIATDPRYGTSEPAPVALIQAADGSAPPTTSPTPYVPSCAPAPVTVEPDPPPLQQPPPEPLQLQLPRSIHFALDQAFISPASANVLDQIAAVLLEYPFIIVELQGHTDPRASIAYNQALGERRARAAREYLLRQGVNPERMRIISFGEAQRATSGNTRLDYARDRRVEFIFEDTRGLDIIFEDQETDLQLEP